MLLGIFSGSKPQTVCGRVLILSGPYSAWGKAVNCTIFHNFFRFFQGLANILEVHFSRSLIGQNWLVNIDSIGP